MRGARRFLTCSLVPILAANVLLGACTTAHRSAEDLGIRATTDAVQIERGRHLVYGPGHCAACHGDPARANDIRRGKPAPLSGGKRFDLGPLGTIVAPNITSDPQAGIGALSDEQLVRSLRYGVSRDGSPLAPFMSFANLSDTDLQAIISFLRTLPPRPDRAAPSELTWLGELGLRYIAGAQGPTNDPPAHLEPERNAEYGRYLAHTVANCHGCHTRRSRLTGQFVGLPFGGGMKLNEEDGVFATPNLRPSKSGAVARMSEHEFIALFRARARHPTRSPMPWGYYGRMSDDELGAIYRYLASLPAD